MCTNEVYLYIYIPLHTYILVLESCKGVCMDVGRNETELTDRVVQLSTVLIQNSHICSFSATKWNGIERFHNMPKHRQTSF